MGDWKFGDTLKQEAHPIKQRVMFIAMRSDCPDHNDPPCLVGVEVDATTWQPDTECYITDGWILADEGR